MSEPPGVPSFDDKRVNAVLKVCPECQRPYYFTNHQRVYCYDCRNPYETDVNGVPIDGP